MASALATTAPRYGTLGRVLVVDLTSGASSVETLDESVYRQFLAGGLHDEAERQGVGMRAAIENSPHLRHTLMLNGERCPVDANLGRPLANGDRVYLLAPLAGG